METGNDRAGYEFLEHTADAKIRAYGSTFEERFGNAAIAMFTIILDECQLKGDTLKQISVKGKDKGQLFYNFMEELLFLIDAEGFFTKRVVSMKISETEGSYHLDAELCGDNHHEGLVIDSDVKAMTYAEMEFGDGYVQFVVDI